ncbi:putative U-box domain-containing protein 50 [Citrus sinensis]|uniref:U-box domain-containing protein 50 n=1 Tax=Citrus sinensis TaxID=2711 RepID=A0ACB8J717_CITSI|nr:putative U-box domain-containing protein 50 [Citrus sinensis]
MDTEEPKVYVAVGNDLQDGYRTLDWTIRKWKAQSISIVILHVTYNISIKDFVYTPFGKLPATSLSDEKLEILKKYEQGKTDNLLSKYLGFCGKVKAEILKVEKSDEPVHKLILDLVSRLTITKLVMGLSFMIPSAGKSRTAVSGSYFVHHHMPDYCELFIICGGKLVSLKGENDEGIMEDDQGVKFAKMRERVNFGNLWTKMFSGNGRNPNRLSICSRGPDADSPYSQSTWENCVQEIEIYFQHLSSLNLDEASNSEDGDEILQTLAIEPNAAEQIDSNMADQLESLTKEDVASRMEIQRDLDSLKEQSCEVIRDVEESKNRLSSLIELQSELSNKLQLSTMAKGHAEAQLEKAVIARAEMVKDIEELRRQRDVLHRRIEFCKEKDAIGMVIRSSELSCAFREYTAEDIRLATEDFSERFRLKCAGDWTNVYRGRLNHASVAIKMLNNGLSEEDFQAKVSFLTDVRHPHLVAVMGCCSELKCIVFEYMPNGNLRDKLFTSQRNYKNCSRARALRWPDRIRIAHEVCLGLNFLHSTEPRPIVHGSLTPSSILLDRNLVAKISGLGLNICDQLNVRSDIRAFGTLLLHLLTGRNWAGLVEEAMALDQTTLMQVLDGNAGIWPLELADELAGIALKCLSADQDANRDLRIAGVMKELDEVRKKADGLADKRESEVVTDRCANKEDSNDVPSVFICPIFQEVMKTPHVAADGFSYELEAMEEWLGMGHDTSPMTNLRLKHKYLTPNHTLRSLIQEWHNKQSSVHS